MVRVRGNRWVLLTILAVVAVLAGSLLVGIQTSQAKRWVFEEGFTVERLAVSEDGDYFATASRPAASGAPSVLHYFRVERVDWNASVPDVVSALALADNGALVAAGLENGDIHLHTGRGAPLGVLPTQGPVHDLDVSGDGGLIAAAVATDHRDDDRGGILLYRLGRAAPLLHLPKADAAGVALSDAGDVLVGAIGTTRATQIVLYDLAISADRPYLIDTYPGTFQDLQISSDGRHALVVTSNAAFLLARGHERPVGIVPTLPDATERYAGGALAANGQSYLLTAADGQSVALHKWGEKTPRWTHDADTPLVAHRLDAGGDRAVVVEQDGTLTVLSVTTGRPLKELTLLGDPRTMVPSEDGGFVLASDDQGRLYRTRSGYAGLLGLLPDAIVSTLYAQPTALLWLGVLVALGAVGYPIARPVVARYLGRTEAEEPDLDLDAIGRVPLPARHAEPLDGPIRVDRLVVRPDDTTILKAVTLHAERGTLTAVVGGSGEGKSTLLRALIGRGVTGGTVRLGSLDPVTRPDRVPRLVGFVPQDLQLYGSLSALENLLAFGGQYGIARETLQRSAHRYLALVGLDPENRRPVAHLSGGERRRVSIAATLLNDPAVLILDEPTTGLDPLTRRQLWRLLATLRARLGVTVLVSTHYLEEAQGADNVILLEDGRVLACGSPQHVVQTAPGGPALWTFRLPDGPRGALLAETVRQTAAAAGLSDLVREVHADDDTVQVRLLDPHTDAARLLRALRQSGIEPRDATWVGMRFEDAFIAHIAEARHTRERSTAAGTLYDGPHATVTDAARDPVRDASLDVLDATARSSAAPTEAD